MDSCRVNGRRVAWFQEGVEAMKVRFAVEALALSGLLLYGCTKSPRASGERGVLRGTVSYRERIALPFDAVVHVTLSDVARQDAAAPVIAEKRIPSEGQQVPLSFELPYERSKIEAGGAYAVRATIESGGQMWFTTDTVQRVLTQGNPSDVSLMLVRPVSNRGLAGSTWRLESLGGEGVLDQVEATLEFLEQGRVAGRGSCNRFFGAAKIEGGTISFGPLGTSRMACPEPVSQQEAKYLAALQAAERFTLEGSALLLFSEGAEEPLRFVRDSR